MTSANSPLARIWCGAALLVGGILFLSSAAAQIGQAQQPAAENPAEEKPAAAAAAPVDKFADADKDVTQGALRIVGEGGKLIECPLQHTDVAADVSGFIARVKVTQTFHNPTKEKIEAVYVFPLPHQAAVDDMTMKIGDRKIVGLIKRRAEARQIYEQALQAGQTAALLEQERPNIFTQSVGNIGPGERIDIEISYVDVLKYDMGTYEFHYPMVVGPRYIPGNTPAGPAVPDAQKISPPVLKPGERTGHDVSVTVNLDAGVPIQNLSNANHKVHTIEKGKTAARVRLLQEDAIPNKDFVLRYDVMGEKPELAVLSHTGDYAGDAKRLGNGYFLLMIQPKEDERLKQSPPREVVFLVDVSGSMRGEPTEKVKGAMKQMLELCREQDTVQVVTFASQAKQLFEKPLPVNKESIAKAIAFTDSVSGSGGTEMLKGVTMAMEQPADAERIRIIVMLTDGYIGNEAQIIEHVGKKCGDRIRFWAIGMGQSPNMFLIDGVARQGGGMGKKLGLKDDTAALTTEVMTRIQRAQLANVNIDYGDLQVSETYPARLPELWAGRPVIVYGRYTQGGAGKITISGNVEGEAVSWPIEVTLAAEEPQHDVLAKVWAREKIEDLMQSTYYAGSPAVEEEVTALALQYKLMSQYTSFVAVDAEQAGELEGPATPPRRMMVPVPLPEGTSYEGFFGDFAEAGDRLLSERVMLGASLDAAPAKRDRAAADFYKSLSSKPQSAESARRSLAQFGSNRMMDGLAKSGGRQVLQQQTRGLANSRAAMPAAGFGGGGFAGPGAPSTVRVTPLALKVAVEEKSKAVSESEYLRADGDVNFTYAALQATAAETIKEAQEALKQGQQLKTEDKLDAARAALTRAYLLDMAAANVGHSNGETAGQALAALEEMQTSQAEAWSKALPALDKRLDLVLRDATVAAALEQVAAAGGLEIALLAGSLDDAAALTGAAPHVRYLDLRRATVAQALDWILLPERLTWRLEGTKIVAASDRRREGTSAWVYDVSTIALPSQQELADLKDHAKAQAAASKAAADFLAASRTTLKPADEKSLAWFGPGQLLIVGDAKLHAAAAKLFANLADAAYAAPETLKTLHAATSKRAESRKEPLAKLAALRQLHAVAETHEQFGWQLLAAAAGGQVDLEALTELQIALRSPETKQLLSGDGPAVALRSLWIVREAARALPENAELKALASSHEAEAKAAIGAAIEAVRKNADDASAYSALLYGALALRSDAALSAAALPLLTGGGAKDSPLASARVLAAALLDKSGAIDRAALLKQIESGAAGEDMLVLLSLASRRAGGDVWQAFRAQQRELLANSPISGSIVVLIGRLSQPQLELVAER